jgi:hypothetical protein
MEDIVERLRVLNFKGPWQEAADEIERLREEIKHLRNMLAMMNLHKNSGYKVRTIGFDDALKEGK